MDKNHIIALSMKFLVEKDKIKKFKIKKSSRSNDANALDRSERGNSLKSQHASS